MEASADAIIGWTLEGAIFGWNVGAEKLFGYSNVEAVGQYVAIIVPPERQVEIESLRRKTEADETMEGYETVLMKKDGTRVDVSLTVSPIRDPIGGNHGRLDNRSRYYSDQVGGNQFENL